MNPVSASLDGAVAEILLNNPPLNLMDQPTIEAFEKALDEVGAWVKAGTCRALLLRAEGRVFCAGVDVHTFLGHDPHSGTRHIARHLALTHKLEALRVPTLSVVHGLCLTIGFELSLGCDMLWAAEDAKFGLVEANVGLTPGGGGTQRLAARAGYARAAELVYTGDLYPAEELLRWGVANRVLPGDNLLTEARSFARRLAAGPTLAHGVAKSILLAGAVEGIGAADRATAQGVGPLLATDDLAHGVRTLLDHGPNKATFQGR